MYGFLRCAYIIYVYIYISVSKYTTDENIVFKTDRQINLEFFP